MENKIIDLIFESVPIVVLGMFAGLANLLTSRRHLTVRVTLGVFSTTAIVVLAGDMISIEKELSIGMRIFFGIMSGFCARDIASTVAVQYKKFIEKNAHE